MPSVIEQPVKTSAVAASRVDLSREQYRTLLALITLAAAFIRFRHLGTRGFMIDEGFSWFTTTLSWPELLHSLTTRNAQMTIHYVLLHAWSFVGDSEFALRSISAIFGIATVPLVAALGKRLYSRQVGIVAAVLLSVHVFAIQYSQELRTYPVAMFFVTLSWLFLFEALQGPTSAPWVKFVVVTVVGFYCHFFVAFNIVAQVATLIFLPPSVIQWKKVRIAGLTLFACFLPAIFYSLTTNTEDLNWIRPTDRAILWEFLDRFSGMSGAVWQASAILLLWAIVALKLFLVVSRERRGWKSWTASFPVVGVLVPFVILVVLSIFRPLFVPRYIGYTVVPLVIGLALWCCSLKRELVAGAAVVLIVVFAWPMPAYYRQTAFQDFRGAANYVSLHCGPGDGVVVWEPMARPAVEYYGRRHPGFPEFIFPQSGGRFHVEDMLQRPDPFALPAAFGRHPRIWVVYDLPDSPAVFNITPALYFERAIARTHHQLSVHQFKNARVEEYVRD